MKHNTCDICGISYSPIFGGYYDRESKQQVCHKCAEKRVIRQIQLPDPKDEDEHPRLLVDGEGIHAGQCFKAFTPGGWVDIRLEISRNKTGPGCWYIATEGYRHLCPIGLFVRRPDAP